MNKRDEIISTLYRSEQIDSLISKINPPSIRDDLKQELFVVICGMPEDILFGLHERNELHFYCVRIVLNLAYQTSGRFYNYYRKSTTDIDFEKLDIREDEYDASHEKLVKEAKKIIDWLSTGEHDYYGNIFQVYLDMGCSSLKVSEATDIPARSIRKTVSDVREYIKNRLQKYLK